ncbi:hypothetical protein CERZMDRAFT_96793 [Cercospora zeae-maydis SCOH1-5]|uniref:Uncharacterized protein n=1 Tax=Cercospora zeae-maydis SCOH1-5 TaxID=717836 RepID=A0A6A6FI67_9PEZI|nr:hypothetical protein CERZMDRAFT_96793 [Cercospora zeae-maydis SCOH1-5]
MASQITIDLSNIGDKVVAAIHESMEKVVEAKVTAALSAAKIDKTPEPQLDMAGIRTQIVGKLKHGAHHREAADRHDQIPANATYLLPLLAGISHYTVPTFDRSRYVLIGGPDAPGEAKALQKLLAMTSEMMLKNWTPASQPEGYGWKLVRQDGNSFYYTAQR